MHTTRFFAMIFQMFAQNQKIGGLNSLKVFGSEK